jgi:isoquinoline 1-oxidoreductase beta subunit
MSGVDMNQASESQDKSGHKWQISRRGFLIGMAITGTAFALGIPIGLPIGRQKIAELIATDMKMPSQDMNPLLWLEILPDNRIRLLVPKAELGQGTHTSLAQIAAEELEIGWEDLEVIHASSTQAEDLYRGTFGSLSIMTLYRPLRQAAATMREMLRAQAAIRLKQPIEKLVARDGGFEIAGDSKTRISYGALVADNVHWQVPKKAVPLKEPRTFKFIGKPMARIDLPGKVTGKTLFGSDIRFDGMLYGAVVHLPTIGAKMLAASPGPAAGMPGVVKVVIEDDFAGVVARSRTQAAAARDAIEVKWDKGHLWQQTELEKMIAVGGPGGTVIQNQGNALAVLEKSKTVTAEYLSGFCAHASLETQAAVADMSARGGRVWTSTQWESAAAGYVAETLGLKKKQVEVIPAYVGGGFGRKADVPAVSHVAVEAARLSRVVGAPVQIIWDRTEEMRNSFYRPIVRNRFFAALDDKGHINAISVQHASGQCLEGSMPKFVSRVAGFDFGASNGIYITYHVPHRHTVTWAHPLPIPTGPWRSVGLFPNTFAKESFMDELAHAAHADPLQFRLDHLPKGVLGQRLRMALRTAADRAGWGKTVPAGRARGIACCIYTGTVVAEVAEISLNQETGRIRVHKVTAAIDPGRSVNPNQVIAQVEGSVVMGTSAALIEEIIIRDGRVEAENFDQYPLLRLSEAPAVETILLEAPDGRPRGVGEPPIGPVAPAIGNALFALTGVRLRQLPMTPERVQKALKAKDRSSG